MININKIKLVELPFLLFVVEKGDFLLEIFRLLRIQLIIFKVTKVQFAHKQLYKFTWVI